MATPVQPAALLLLHDGLLLLLYSSFTSYLHIVCRITHSNSLSLFQLSESKPFLFLLKSSITHINCNIELHLHIITNIRHSHLIVSTIPPFISEERRGHKPIASRKLSCSILQRGTCIRVDPLCLSFYLLSQISFGSVGKVT